MACKSNLVYPSCEINGVGFTSQPVAKGQTRIQLQKGQGKNFPALQSGQHYYITVNSCSSCCETMRVVGHENDVLIVERGLNDACDCISSNARVEISWWNEWIVDDITSVIKLNVMSPLKYDCATNTLSVDCAELLKGDCGGCDCGEGAMDVPVGNSGLRGPPGPPGKDAPKIVGATVTPTGQLTFSLSDGSTVVSTGRVPKGPKGDKGDKGSTGQQGDTGAQGENASSIARGERFGNALKLTMSDDSEVLIENVFVEPPPVTITSIKRVGDDLEVTLSTGSTAVGKDVFKEGAGTATAPAASSSGTTSTG